MLPKYPNQQLWITSLRSVELRHKYQSHFFAFSFFFSCFSESRIFRQNSLGISIFTTSPSQDFDLFAKPLRVSSFFELLEGFKMNLKVLMCLGNNFSCSKLIWKSRVWILVSYNVLDQHGGFVQILSLKISVVENFKERKLTPPNFRAAKNCRKRWLTSKPLSLLKQKELIVHRLRKFEMTLWERKL